MDLRHKTKKELYTLARQYNIPNRSKMNKDILANALMSIVFPGTRLPVLSSMTVTGNLQGQPAKNQTKAPVFRPCPVRQPGIAPYPIPLAYERDLLALMPIDPSRAYVCWELSSRTKEQYQIQLKTGDPHILLKLYMKNQDKNDVLESVRVGQIGSYVFNHYLPGRECWVEMGVNNETGAYFSVMVSRRIKMPDDQIHETGEFVSMTVKKNAQGLLDLSGFTRIKNTGDNLHTVWKGSSSTELTRRQK